MTDAPSMAGKYVLVTGGTGGIGKATAAGLAALGAQVGITGRDQGRAAAAAAGIRAATGSCAVDIFAADMSSQVEVRRLAAQVLGTYPPLDVLVNNVRCSLGGQNGGYFASSPASPAATADASRWWPCAGPSRRGKRPVPARARETSNGQGSRNRPAHDTVRSAGPCSTWV